MFWKKKAEEPVESPYSEVESTLIEKCKKYGVEPPEQGENPRVYLTKLCTLINAIEKLIATK